MSLKSSETRYGRIAASIHWLSALGVILMLASGMAMGRDASLVAPILPFHLVLGLLVGALTVLRILWWWLVDTKPLPVAGIGSLQERAAHLMHLALYGAILIMVASGVAMVALSGAAPAIFAGGTLPAFDTLPPFGAHDLVSKLMLALVIGHIGAALWHQFIKRDGLIGRMRLGS